MKKFMELVKAAREYDEARGHPDCEDVMKLPTIEWITRLLELAKAGALTEKKKRKPKTTKRSSS